MPLTKDELISKLKAAGVAFDTHEHATVMTVEAQVQALQGVQGTVLKNLFVKDKKNRLYIFTAVPETKVDLNILSARLGTGKGGLRFAPEELLDEVLKVPPGSVTPLAVANEEAAKVVLLLDQRIREQAVVIVHPLVNTASLVLAPSALEAALKAVGREAIFVDMEADPKIDRDNPPDLSKYTVAAEPKPEAGAAAAGAAAVAAAAPAPAAAAAPAKAAAGKAAGGKAAAGAKAAAAQAPSAYEQLQTATDVIQQTELLMDKMAHVLLGKSLAEARASLDTYQVRRLQQDLESQLTSLKNAAYTLGHRAGKGEVQGFVSRAFA